MTLLVDIGNSYLKYIEAEHRGADAIKTVSVASLTLSWLEQHWRNTDKIVIASVNSPTCLELITQWANNESISTVILKSEAQCLGVKAGYDLPEQLGVDRWLALLGAAVHFPNQHVLIVDAGTATTIDILSAQGSHLGGWIIPGYNTMFTSVLNGTKNVNASLSSPELSFATNTSDNVNNGCWAATVGAINLALEQANKTIPIKTVILTGGNAQKISTLLTAEHLVIEALIFDGMASYSH